MRYLVRFTLHLFYRQVEVVGLEHVPAPGQGPVVFVGNHPNSLIDPMLVIATCGRFVHFAAKDGLFRNRLTGFAFRALGAVPIRRRQDHGGGRVDNASAFSALFGALRGGRCVGIFPEGISHDGAQLARLKTGAARLALGFQPPDHPFGQDLKIIPCGLSYHHRRHFRSRVLVQYGPEIPWSRGAGGNAGEGAEPRREDVHMLTSAMEAGLRALTVNAGDWETLRVLDAVRRLYQPPRTPLAQRVELARRFAGVYDRVRDQPEVRRLFARVRDYQLGLRELGLSDHQLRAPLRVRDVLSKSSRQLWWLIVWLPLAVPGLVLHAPIGVAAVAFSEGIVRRKDVVATRKLLSAAALALLLYGVVVAAAAWRYGALGALGACAFLPVTGVANVRVLDRFTSLRRVGRGALRPLIFRREHQRFRALRCELEKEIRAAVDRYRPDEMRPLFAETRTGEVPRK